jgi:hypothetical protein
MGIFYGIQSWGSPSKRNERKVGLFTSLLTKIKTSHPDIIANFALQNFTLWKGAPIRPVEKHLISTTILTMCLADLPQNITIEANFEQTFLLDEEYHVEGILRLENHPSQHADVSVQYFFETLEYDFDKLFLSEKGHQYFYKFFIRPWTNADPNPKYLIKQKHLVKQINVGDNAFPLANISQTLFYFIDNNHDFIC